VIDLGTVGSEAGDRNYQRSVNLSLVVEKTALFEAGPSSNSRFRGHPINFQATPENLQRHITADAGF
jgi:hypothetical protein